MKVLEQKELNSSKSSGSQEITKLHVEINKMQLWRTYRIIEIRSWFFEKINKIDKPLSKIIKRQREHAQIKKIRNEKEDITQTLRKS